MHLTIVADLPARNIRLSHLANWREVCKTATVLATLRASDCADDEFRGAWCI